MKRIIASLFTILSISIATAQLNLGPTIGVGALPLDSDPICVIPNVGGASNILVVGDTIPHFNLYDMAGNNVDIEQTLLQGKAVLIMDGSYTCPAFRNKMQELHDIDSMYGDKIQSMIIYVVEAHPEGPDVCPYSGLVNEANNAAINNLHPQPTTYGERKVIAQAFVDSMGNLLGNIPLYMDGPCNEWWHSFGEAPNNGFLIHPDGEIKIAHVWFDKIPEDMFSDLAIYIAANPTLGTPEFQNTLYKVYPNPATTGTQLQVEVPNNIVEYTVELRNITGRIVLTEQNSSTIDLYEVNCTPGLYLWSVTATGQQPVTGKLIIQ